MRETSRTCTRALDAASRASELTAPRTKGTPAGFGVTASIAPVAHGLIPGTNCCNLIEWPTDESVFFERLERMRRRYVMVSAVVSGLVLVTAAGAGALLSGPSAVSGTSPYATGCEGVAQSASAFGGTEVEPFVATDPTNPKHAIGVWQQDRFPNGGSRGLGTAVTTDGGLTWTTVVAPAFSRCAGGVGAGTDYERATDPWVTFGADGKAYQISDSFNDTNLTNAILVSRSLDGGFTWSAPTTVLRETGNREVSFAFNDKESITADPYVPCNVYATWDRLTGPSLKSRGSSSAFEHAQGYRGPTWFARSTDCGATWEPARQVYDPGQVNQTIGNQIAVLPNGTLVNTFDLISNFKNAKGQRGENIAVQLSLDKGLTWGPAVVAAKGMSVGVTALDGTALRTGDNIPDIAIGADGGIYLVWQDGRFSGGAHEDIALSESHDGGATWSSPSRVNVGDVAAFNPAVEITKLGRLGVSYHELRGDAVTRVLATRGPSASVFSTEVVAGGASSLITSAPVALGYFLGDYQGLTAMGEKFLSFAVMPDASGPTNGTNVVATIS